MTETLKPTMTTTEFTGWLDKAGIEWSEYSGRYMYGARCVAVDDMEPLDILAQVIAKTDINEQGKIMEMIAVMREVTRDDLGKGFIVYWRDMAVEE